MQTESTLFSTVNDVYSVENRKRWFLLMFNMKIVEGQTTRNGTLIIKINLNTNSIKMNNQSKKNKQEERLFLFTRNEQLILSIRDRNDRVTINRKINVQ